MIRILLAAAILAAGAWAQTRAVVTVPVANMFSKASADADVVSQARYGSVVTIEKTEGEWRHILTPGDNYPGWVRAAELREGTYKASAYTESLRTHVYREASVTKHAPLLTLPYESPLEVIGERPENNERWIEVRLADGRTGFVQRGDLRFDTTRLDIPALVQLAHRFLGLPYTWGGTSSFGYDCSGFAQMLVRRGGVELPRDAQPQADFAPLKAVERAALKPGDLLYFGSSAKKITHTGFYLGNGEFIHATTNTHPVLQLSRLDDKPWTTLFVAARRWK
jgi:SH3-like domain-containing protein